MLLAAFDPPPWVALHRMLYCRLRCSRRTDHRRRLICSTRRNCAHITVHQDSSLLRVDSSRRSMWPRVSAGPVTRAWSTNGHAATSPAVVSVSTASSTISQS
jgi:hypothetical protein